MEIEAILRGGTCFAHWRALMHIVESLRALASPESATVAPEARVWDCSSASQVFYAAFEVHDEALRAGFMPDEATTLSLSLAELGTSAATHGEGAKARVSFEEGSWRLEVSEPRTAGLHRLQPALKTALPRPLTSLKVRTEGEHAVVVAKYERRDGA